MNRPPKSTHRTAAIQQLLRAAAHDCDDLARVVEAGDASTVLPRLATLQRRMIEIEDRLAERELRRHPKLHKRFRQLLGKENAA